MNGFDFTLAGVRLTALGSGALWWAQQRTLCVSDLHLGKSERHARRGGSALPPMKPARRLTGSKLFSMKPARKRSSASATVSTMTQPAARCRRQT